MKVSKIDASICTRLFVLFFLLTTGVSGQSLNYTPSGLLDAVYDNNGKAYALGDIAIDDAIRYAASLRPGYSGAPSSLVSASGCSSGYFQMYFDSGWGGSSTDEAVLCQVFSDISSFITSPLTGGSQKINIWVRNIGSTGAPSGVAAMASSFFVLPNVAGLSGIVDNTIWITANSGQDAYTNVSSPLSVAGGTYSTGATYFHGMMAFDFSGGVSWNNLMTDTTHAGQIDLYQTALHEILHAMGFSTLINYNGLSRLGSGFKYFTRYDRQLQTQSAVPLITNSGCSMYNYGFNSSLSPSSVLSPGGTTGCPLGYASWFSDTTVCSAAVIYADGTVTVPVYTPRCYESGSTLCHFEDECYGSFPSGWPLSATANRINNDQYFAMSNRSVSGPYSAASNPGAMKRHPTIEERQVFCDIGYKVGSAYSISSSTYHNYYNYGGSACGTPVAGINDGITAGGAYTYNTPPGIPVAINGGSSGFHLMGNDYDGATGMGMAGGHFKCLEVLTGSGTVSDTSGTDTTTVYYTPSSSDHGLQLLRYVPVSAAGVVGNITYVYINVSDTSCIANACNLVSNGGFERSDSLAYNSMGSSVHCWNEFSTTPDIYSRTSPSSDYRIPTSSYCTPATDVHFPGTSASLPNNHFLGMLAHKYNYSGIFFVTECAQTQLTSGLVNGQSYRVSCWVKIGRPPGTLGYYTLTTLPTFLGLALSPSPTPLATSSSGAATVHGWPSTVTAWMYFRISQPDSEWHLYDTTLTYTGSFTANTLVIGQSPWKNSNTVAPYDTQYSHHIYIDDISIRPSGLSCTFSLPADTCADSSTTMTLFPHVGTAGGTFTWLTTPVSGGIAVISHSSTFRPYDAYLASIATGGSGLITIGYTYTDILGCSSTVYSQIRVHSANITGPHSLCGTGVSSSLTGTATGGIWTTSSASIASVSAAGVVTTVMAGTAIITYTIAGTGCADTSIIRVIPNPLPITGTTHICVGSTSTLSDLTTGGAWSSGASAVASVNPVSGVVSGISGGTAIITYMITGGCFVTVPVTIDTIPVVNAGIDRLNCSGVPLTASVGGATTAVPGYSYSWTPATGLSATNVYNPIANPAVTTSYIVTVTRAISGCHASDTVIVVAIPSGSICHPCTDFSSSPFTVLGASGIINTNVPAGNYYIANNVGISGNVKFTDAVIEIANGAKIEVGQFAQLKLEGCHLFSCSGGMWDGLRLLGSGGHIGNITLTGNATGKSTLIEDAVFAVDVSVNSASPLLTPGSPYYLTSDNTVFNRNHMGIFIQNYNSPVSGLPGDTLTYEFLIKNTVFTGRDFSLFKLSGIQYPYNWPSTMGPYGLKTGWNPATLFPATGAYMAPFNIANPHAGPPTTAYPGGVPYPGLICHDGYFPDHGIHLVSAGAGVPPQYASVVIGMPSTANVATGALNTELNLFDTLIQGINGYNANLITRNCAFMNMASFAYDPSGLSMSTADNKKYQLVIEPGIHTFGGTFPSTTFSPNFFYNCRYGVKCFNYYHIRCEKSQMISTNGSNYIGYDVKTRYYDTIKLLNNRITNHDAGIVVKMDNGGTPIYGGVAGQTTINSNLIQATLPTSTMFTGITHTGIWVDNTIAYIPYSTGGSSPPPAMVNVDANYLKDVFNGIYVNGVTSQIATSSNDTIYKISQNSNDFGIWHTNCSRNVVQKNMINGTETKWDSSFGIRSSHCYNNTVTCNYVNNVGRGFQFDNTHLNNSWMNNTMNNCGKGFVIKGATIGTQGDYHHASSNKWTVSGSFGWSLASGHFQTFTDACSPLTTSLWVRSGSVYDPIINKNLVNNCLVTYGCIGGATSGSGNGLAVTSFPYTPICTVLVNPNMGGWGNVVLGNAGIAKFDKQHNWTAQQELWEAMVQDDTLGSTSDTLNAFRILAGNSRYALLAQIEGLLGAGDITGAQLQLTANAVDDFANVSTDTTTGAIMVDSAIVEIDTIVKNYRNYYAMYIRYQLGTFSLADSADLDSLASACPVTNGAVVYRARALYNSIFHSLRIFDNDCGSGAYVADSIITDSTVVRDSIIDDSTASRAIGNSIKYGNGAQAYELHPNPNNGNFMIHQYNGDGAAVAAEIYDAIGRVIYRSDLMFTNPEIPLNLQNATPGIYLLKLRDSQGRNFTFKFVVR